MEKPFTVILLRPATDWDGPPANWVLRMHVDAEGVGEAIIAAVPQAIREYYSNPDGTPQVGNNELAVIAVFPGHVAVFPGHLDDSYDPEGD